MYVLRLFPPDAKDSGGARGAGVLPWRLQYWIPYQTVKINDCLRRGLAPES
jgi:hypothetical protein